MALPFSDTQCGFKCVEEAVTAVDSRGLSSFWNELMQVSNITFLLQLLVPLGILAVLAPIELMIVVPTIFVFFVYTGPPFGMVGTIYTWHGITAVILKTDYRCLQPALLEVS